MQHTAESPILVIGATGRHGGTGATVVDCLLRRGHSVRALIRTDDERAGELRRRGAETVVGDLHDRGSLVPAFDGVRAVYFTYPVAPGIIPAAANVASVLSKHASAAHLVVMSMAVSALDSPSKLGQAQAVAEDIFIWAGLNPTVLRFAGLFHENIAVLHQRTIQRDAVIANSFGGCAAPWISGDDAAEIAAAHLLTPRPDSPRISYPPPAEAITHTELARIISATAGRPVRYEHISAAAWQRQLELAAKSSARSMWAWRNTSRPSARPCRGGANHWWHRTRPPWRQCSTGRPRRSLISFGATIPTSPPIGHKPRRSDHVVRADHWSQPRHRPRHRHRVHPPRSPGHRHRTRSALAGRPRRQRAAGPRRH